jgi:hypothetical protein
MRKALIGSGQDRAFAGITEAAGTFAASPALFEHDPENRFTLFRIMLQQANRNGI